MADLLSILSNGSASLAAQRAAAATASHNLENASTPGYARQRAEIVAVLPAEQVMGAFIGRGAQLGSVTQARDRFLEAQIPAANGQAARSAAESAALSAVHALDPQAAGGLSAALSAFYGGMRALSQNASDMGLRQAAVASARSLALAFNQTSREIAQARAGLDAEIGGWIPEVNGYAQQVADLNRQIRVARASGAEPNDLLDARQKALDRLAELVGGTPVASREGDVNVALSGGAALVSGDRAGVLSALPDPSNGGHLSLRLAAPDGSLPSALPAAAAGGSIGGALDARDGALAAAATAVDGLAFDLAGVVNAVHRAGYGLDGATGRDLFDAGPSAAGAASRLAVSAPILGDPRALAAASSVATLPGDASSLLALVATESQGLSSGLDAAGSLSALTAGFGAAAERALALSRQDGSVKDHLLGLRESTSGVSIDEEMIEMQKAQRAFEAIIKVIQAASDMFDTLMKLK